MHKQILKDRRLDFHLAHGGVYYPLTATAANQHVGESPMRMRIKGYALEQCPSINFFCSPEHLGAWQAQRPGERGEGLDVPRAFERGREVFGNLLNPEGNQNGQSV